MYQLFTTRAVVNIPIAEGTGCARCARLTQMSQNMMFCVSFVVRFVFLGSFAKLREVTISLAMSVCLSVRPHGTTRHPLDELS